MVRWNQIKWCSRKKVKRRDHENALNIEIKTKMNPRFIALSMGWMCFFEWAKKMFRRTFHDNSAFIFFCSSRERVYFGQMLDRDWLPQSLDGWISALCIGNYIKMGPDLCSSALSLSLSFAPLKCIFVSHIHYMTGRVCMRVYVLHAPVPND